MTRFVDRRLAAITQALDVLAGQLAALQQKLAALDGADLPDDERTREREALNGQITQNNQLKAQLASEESALTAAKPLDVDDLTYQLATVAFLAGVTTAGPILTLVQQDPFVLALGNAALITPALEQAIINVPKSSEQLAFSPLAYLANVQAAVGSDDAFDQLVTAAHHQWFALPTEQRPYFYNDFGVLLPVRLETLFEQDGSQWKMYLRIIPDEASIRRDNPVVTDFEIKSLQEMWQDIYDNLKPQDKTKRPVDWLDTPHGTTEWQIMCNRFGGARATWLISTYLPDVTGGTVAIHAQAGNDVPPPNRVGGFPDQIEVWIAFQGQKATKVKTTAPIQTSELVFDVLGRSSKQNGGNQEPQDEKDRWWVSFQAAKAVGLGVEWVLPDTFSPQDITTLYVVGISNETPTAHFQAQIDAGEMAIMKLGEATNAVDGKPAANLAKDAETWRKVVKQRLRGATSYLSAALTGQDKSLSVLPDANDGNVHSYSTDLVRALWPALWGHFLKDLWGQGENAHLVGLWACAERDPWTLPNLCPEGPLPPIRISNQPYGLLPTSSLQRWTVAPEEANEAQLENRMREPLLLLRRYWATQARNKGNVVGKDTAYLLDMIAHDAQTDRYIYRYFLPAQYFEYFYEAIAHMTREQFFSWLEKLFTPSYKAMNTHPQRHYMTYGHYLNLKIPLVTPTHWPTSFYVPDDRGQPILAMQVSDAFQKVIQSILQDGYEIIRLWQDFSLTLPDSLLIRLLIYANLHSAATVMQAESHDQTPLLEPLVNPNPGRTKIEQAIEQMLADRTTYDPDKTYTTNAGKLHTIMKDAFQTLTVLYQLSPEQLERSLRATLDTASHRIDPWITGFAWRRLKQVGRTSTARFSMGVYGWVDGPIDASVKPGPTKGGLLHAPSYPQALTSVILRDKFLSEPVEGAVRNPWDMKLESNLIRMAEELAQETRIGSHIHEALGRRVERIIGTREGVKALRTIFPLRPKQLEPNVVCNGLDALHGLLDTPPAPLDLSLEQRAALDLLRRTADAYSDLLVAESVHQVVTGHGDITGAAMDAAAGLDKPPTLEILRTPASGYSLNTSVITVIPFKETGDVMDASPSPGSIADASVAAFLETLLGTADQWQWYVDPNTPVMLSDLKLEPIDTVMLSKDLLEDCVRFKLGIAKSAEVKLQGKGVQNHLLAREIIKVLGSQPALFKDIGNQSDQNKDEIAQLDSDILTELKNRYALITKAATFMLTDLQAAADEPARKQVVFRALRWGITPMVNQDEQTVLFAAIFNGTDPQDTTFLTRLTTQALESLQKRLNAAPKPDTLKQPQQIATAIAELAAPEGQLAILSKMGAQKLQATTGIVTANVDTTLDSDWLSVVAAVRPSLARLEAIQLEAEVIHDLASFATWSSAPQDHWQTSVIAANEQQRSEHGGGGLPPLAIPRFIAAFSTGNVWSPEDATGAVAVGLLDSWSEGVPVKQHVTTAAAGFAAPVARPPQAILLAVPPELRKPLDTQTLIDILDETRELAHARAVMHKDLEAYLPLAPSMLLDATGITGIKLAPDTKFPE